MLEFTLLIIAGIQDHLLKTLGSGATALGSVNDVCTDASRLTTHPAVARSLKNADMI
jgi:hypothetical protein